MSTSSTNCTEFLCRAPRDGLLDRMDRNKSAALTVILELHLAGDLREQRVILTQADVEAGLVLASALADENRAAGHEVAVEPLDAEPLRVAVAAVTRRSLSFFCCHRLTPECR